MKSLENSFYAPILVFVHTRFDHFKICIESLLKCSEAKYSHLFISSDFQRNDDEKVDVDLIRNYVKTIKGFKSVTPIFFNKNVGIQYASKFSTNKIFESYDQIIMLEDDIEVSSFFLTYMNQGLSFYKDNPNVFSICGFSPYILSKNYSKFNTELISSNRWNAWGFGSWKNKFKQHLKFRYDASLIKNLENENKKGELKLISDKLSRNYYPHFLYCIKENKLPAFDHLVSLYCLKNNLVNIYCQSTFTKNYGHDGSGLHSAKDSKITTHMLNDFSQKLPKFISSEKLMFTNDLPFINENKIISLIKILLIKVKLFDLIKNYFRKVFK
jgi:hypothetical protein